MEKLLQLLSTARQQCPVAVPGNTIESLVKDKAAGFAAAMYDPVKRDSYVLYNTGDVANTGVVAYDNTGVVANTEVCQWGSKMPVMGYEDTESEFDQKWRAYLGEDG